MKISKKVLTTVLATIMGLSMVACSSTGKDKSSDEKTKSNEIATKITKPVEVEFWHAMSGSNEEALKKIVSDFESKNENIKIKLVFQGNYRELFDKLMAAAKGNTLPTMAQIYSNRLSWYVGKDLVENLNPYIENKEIGLSEEDMKDIPKLFFEDGKWDNKQYAMPFNKSQMLLYYNKDMLNEAGVEVPTTWEEWKEASKKLTVDKDGDGNPKIYGTVFENGISTDIAPWVKQSGGEIIDEENNKINFNTPETKEAVGFINSMIQDKTARLAGEDKNSNIPFNQGKAAFCVASTSAIPFIKDGIQEGTKWFAAPLPGNKTNDQLYYGTNVTAFNTGEAEEKLAAWLFMKHLSSAEVTAEFAQNTGYLPVRYSAQETPEYKKFLEENPINGVALKSFDVGFQGARNVGEINALDALGEELELLFNGKKSIDDALKDAQSKGESAMAEARKN